MEELPYLAPSDDLGELPDARIGCDMGIGDVVEFMQDVHNKASAY